MSRDEIQAQTVCPEAKENKRKWNKPDDNKRRQDKTGQNRTGQVRKRQRESTRTTRQDIARLQLNRYHFLLSLLVQL